MHVCVCVCVCVCMCVCVCEKVYLSPSTVVLTWYIGMAQVPQHQDPHLLHPQGI